MSGYDLLPFRFLRFDDARTLVVNETGEHHFLANDDLSRFVKHKLSMDSDAFLDLKAKHFLFDSDSVAPFELMATKIRSKKAFLDGFTSLHIFVVSLRCEHSCHYCQVSRVSADRRRYDMSNETAARARPRLSLARTAAEDRDPGRRAAAAFRARPSDRRGSAPPRR
jgi:hypothetical protein